MSRLTAKYQVTLPKAVAQKAGLVPGDEIDCEPAGDIVRLRSRVPRRAGTFTTTERLMLFDMATERQRHRDRSGDRARGTERGWTRDDLYSDE